MLTCNSILIPTDGTQTSEDVIELICSVYSSISTSIYVVYVIEVPRSLPLHVELPDKVVEAKTALDRAVNIAKKYDVLISTSTIYARTAEDSILTTAKDLKCDVIAIAQDNQRLRIFANMASNIYQRAKCSVWLFNNKSQT